MMDVGLGVGDEGRGGVLLAGIKQWLGFLKRLSKILPNQILYIISEST